MYTKRYVIEYNTSNESMFEDLNKAGFDYRIEDFGDGSYFAINFEKIESVRELQELIHIMRWYD